MQKRMRTKSMLKFDRQGLIPTVIQDNTTGEVLMVAFMNEEALRLTRKTGYTHFFSRSRNAIWRKGEQSGNVQEVRDIFVNCEENSLLIRVIQHGEAACHEGYRSCYYRRLMPANAYETVAERIFDPAIVYEHSNTAQAKAQLSAKLEEKLRQLYGVYLYLRDHDLSEESNTSRLLQEHSQSYLVSRLGDELQELAEVQSGEHIHADRQSDTVLEGSQVGYWLLLLAATKKIRYDDFWPHEAIFDGYYKQHDSGWSVEQQQNCLSLLASNEPARIAQGLKIGFALIGWACAEAAVSPLDPAEYDLAQMRRKGLIGQ
ncbi:MAG TPA: phosphoribosyl-AMP cyclohydrolase [Ktedonobacteraceae bacterium]